jgi:Mlc titration factor MtfA (ptsG expression regulator)
MILIYSLLGIQVIFWVVKYWTIWSPFDKEAIQLIEKYDPWFQTMTTGYQRKFRHRYNNFLRTTKFIFKDQTSPEEQAMVKKIIALAAARLAFKLSGKAFDQYDRIIIYNLPYFSTINRQYHKGEVNPGMGFIIFSIDAILEGFEKREGVNLVYHELAHALWLEHKLFSYDVFKDRDLDEFETLAKKEMTQSSGNAEHFMRNYGYTNLPEFFAVSVENFFERPQAYKEALPDLYASLAKLFKQDFLTQNS